MKKILTACILIFSMLVSPLATDAATKEPTRYDRHTFEQAKKKAESYLQQADSYANSSIKASESYVKDSKTTHEDRPAKTWAKSSNNLMNYAKEMITAIEYNDKYNFDPNFKQWQQSQYAYYNEVWEKNMDAYRFLFRVLQLEKKLTDTQIKLATGLRSNETLYPLLSRMSKGWLDVAPGFEGNIHVLVDTLLSPKFDHPVDIVSGYITEMRLTNIYKDYLKDTNLEDNGVLMSIPSAIGNTVSPMSVGSFTYPYEVQIKLLTIQLQLYSHLNAFFNEAATDFSEYHDVVNTKKESSLDSSTNNAKEVPVEEVNKKCELSAILCSFKSVK